MIAVDQATSSGIAFTTDSKEVLVTEVKGNPIELFKTINQIAIDYNHFLILLEKMVYFPTKGKNRTIPLTSLLERTGYLRYRLIESYLEVQSLHTPSCRKVLGFKGEENNKRSVHKYFQQFDKRITDNCSDALTLLLSQLDNWKDYKITYIAEDKL